MTISASANRVSYTGNGVTTSFSFPYSFTAQADIAVQKVLVASPYTPTVQVLDTDFTISGTADSVGRYVAGANIVFATAPSSSFNIVIYTNPAVAQSLDLVDGDPLPAESVEKALDVNILVARRLADLIGRSLRQVDGDTADIDWLPAKGTRASKYLGFDSDGDPVALDAPVGTTAITTFVATLMDDPDAITFMQTLIATASAEASPAVDDMLMVGDTSEGKGNKMRFDDFLKVVNSLTEDLGPNLSSNSAVGDYALVYSRANAAPRKVILGNIARQRGYLHGCTISNNAGDATNDIDVSFGRMTDSTFVAGFNFAGLTGKQLDAAWAAGSAAGMRDTGAIANGTWHIYVIKKDADGTCDILASASVSAPTMPAGYTFFRRIGSILRESAAIVAFSQNGDEFLRSVSVLDITANNPGTAAVTRTLSVPTGVKVTAIVNWGLVNAAAGVAPYGYVSSLDQSDEAASATAAPLSNIGAAVQAAVGGSASWAAQLMTRTNTSAQVRSRLSASDGNVTLYGATLGWIDNRGRI